MRVGLMKNYGYAMTGEVTHAHTQSRRREAERITYEEVKRRKLV